MGPFRVDVRSVAGVTNADFKPKITSDRKDSIEDKVIPHEPWNDQNHEGQGENEGRPDPSCSLLLKMPNNPAHEEWKYREDHRIDESRQCSKGSKGQPVPEEDGMTQ